MSNLKSVVLTILERLTFNTQSGLIRSLRTDRQTSNKHSISAISSIHLAEISS